MRQLRSGPDSLRLVRWLVLGLALFAAVPRAAAQQPKDVDPDQFVGKWVGKAYIKGAPKVPPYNWEISITYFRGKWGLRTDSNYATELGPFKVENNKIFAEVNSITDGKKLTFRWTATLAGERLTGEEFCLENDKVVWTKEFTLDRKSAPVKTKLSYRVPLRPARPITPVMIDQFLDHLGGLLQRAYDAPGQRTLTPIDCDLPAPIPADTPPDWAQGAELARSVYEQVRAMQTQANRGLFTLTAPQKNRMKAFLHWVEWIQNRGRHPARQFGNGGKLYWQPLVLRATEMQGDASNFPWEEFPATPRWPFQGPVGEVPPPNLRDIVDEPDALIYSSEYAAAMLKTVIEVGEAAAASYFIAGLMSSSYLYLAGRTTSPVALAVLSGVYRAGPVLLATYQNYEALSNWKSLTWDQRWGRVSIIFLAGVHAARAPPAVPRPAAGVRQAPVPEALPEQVAGDYSLRGPTTAAADEVVEVKANIPGATEGQPPGPGTEVTIKVKVVQAGGKPRYFHAGTGEPIIPAGEEGYAEWRSLTGRHYGQNTGKTSVRQALEGTKYEGEAQAIVDEFLQPQANRATLGQRYVSMVQRMVEDATIPKAQGTYPAGQGAPPNTNYVLQIKNGLGEVNDVAVSVGADGQVTAAEVLPPGPSRVVTDPPPLADPARPRPGSLKYNGPEDWESAGGLRYKGHDPDSLNRVEHVLRHAEDIPNRPGKNGHGVFDAGRTGTMATLDEAWAKVKAGGPDVVESTQGARTSYTIDMGRRIGYVGGQAGAATGNPAVNHILLVVENGNEVITAFPLKK